MTNRIIITFCAVLSLFTIGCNNPESEIDLNDDAIINEVEISYDIKIDHINSEFLITKNKFSEIENDNHKRIGLNNISSNCDDIETNAYLCLQSCTGVTQQCFSYQEICEIATRHNLFPLTRKRLGNLFSYSVTPDFLRETVLELLPYLGVLHDQDGVFVGCYWVKVFLLDPDINDGTLFPCPDEAAENTDMGINIVSESYNGNITTSTNKFVFHDECTDEDIRLSTFPFAGPFSTIDATIINALVSRGFSIAQAEAMLEEIQSGQMSPRHIYDLFIDYIFGYILEQEGYDTRYITDCIRFKNMHWTTQSPEHGLIRYQVNNFSEFDHIYPADCL